jgi:hypothetical protein
MENNQVPYIVYESAQSRSERCIKRLTVALILSILLIFISNALWLYAWCQYDYVSENTSYTQDGKGVNNINTNTQGDIDNESEIGSEETE